MQSLDPPLSTNKKIYLHYRLFIRFALCVVSVHGSDGDRGSASRRLLPGSRSFADSQRWEQTQQAVGAAWQRRPTTRVSWHIVCSKFQLLLLNVPKMEYFQPQIWHFRRKFSGTLKFCVGATAAPAVTPLVCFGPTFLPQKWYVWRIVNSGQLTSRILYFVLCTYQCCLIN